MSSFSNKSLAIILLCTLVSLVMATTATALPVPPEADAVMQTQMGSIASDMKGDPVFFNLHGSDAAAVSYGRPYQLLYLDLSRVTDLSSDPSLTRSLLDKGWEYPLLDASGAVVSSAQVSKGEKGWELTGFGLFIPADMVALSGEESAIRDQFARFGADVSGDTKHVRVAPLAVDFILGKSGSESYALLLADPQSSTGLKIGDVYPASTVTVAIVDSLNDLAQTTGRGGAAPVSRVDTTVQARTLSAAVLLVSAGIGVFLISRKRRSA